MYALPNAAKVGVTGTPILVQNKKRTHEIFGPFLDKYTIRESEADGMTVPMLYEGHEVSGRVGEDQTLNQLFETMFRDYYSRRARGH
jgi:type I restriction enzyme R subunit